MNIYVPAAIAWAAQAGLRPSPAFTGRTVTPLQLLLTPRPQDATRLYIGHRWGELAFDDEGGIAGGASAYVSLDAYLNSFYEAYWLRHTRVRSVALSVSGSGRCWCAIRRQTPDGGSIALRHDLLDLDSEFPAVLEVRLAEEERAGRLFLELGGHDGPFTVAELAWGTFEAPRREVKLGVVLCTFNREVFLAGTLEGLLGAPGEAKLARVIVVNQGQDFTHPTLCAIAHSEPDRIRMVRQANFGGAGGFTRGAIELLRDSAITHILFMDDDIILDARHLVTAAAFAAHTETPVVVGGQMLDLFKPTLMFEAGTSVTPDNLLKANHRNLELANPRALLELAEIRMSDFNGWWFSLIPATCFRQQGLPMPIFIRGDDQEYGVRIGRAGVPTVSLPPVSVWHEPFYAKPPGWQLYYDLRNRLIFASLYPDRFRLDGPVQLLKRLLAMLIRYDYQQTWTIILALRDYLAGPDGLDEGAPATHARVLRQLDGHAPRSVTKPEAAPLGDDAHPLDRTGGRVRLTLSFVRLLLGRPKANRAGRDCLIYANMPRDLMHLGDHYTLSDDGDHFFLHMRYSLQRSWSQLVRASLTIARYALGRRKAAAEWRRRMPELVSSQSWASRLGLVGHKGSEVELEAGR